MQGAPKPSDPMPKILDQATLKSLVHYDPATGLFTWLPRQVASKNDKTWNTRYAGKPAGSANERGYICITITTADFTGAFKAHRLAWLYVYGEFPPGELDHANRVKADNSIANLRPATRSQNTHNYGSRKNNKSGAVGVCWHKHVQKWRVEILVSGVKKRLGYFDDFDDACAAYEQASKENVGEYSPFFKQVAA
jgi:hypothetical protein